MTDQAKRFLDEVSQDKAFIEKLTSAGTPGEVIALAAEKGYTLTEEDLKPETAGVKLDDDELNAVSGGTGCGCWGYGLGKTDSGERACNCIVYGEGLVYGKSCACFQVGAGTES